MYSDKQKEQKRQKMLEDCFELFAKQGLENTSINDLANHCKTYKAALYNFFESKDEIVFECAKMYMEKLSSVIFSDLSFPVATLRTTFENVFKKLVAERQNLRCVYQIVSSPKYGEKSRQALSEIYSKYLNYSDVLAEKYSVDKEKLKPCYLLFVATIHDFCLWENEEFVSEKLQYIYKQIDNLQ